MRGWESKLTEQFFWKQWARRRNLEGESSGLEAKAGKNAPEVEHVSCRVSMAVMGKKGVQLGGWSLKVMNICLNSTNNS